MAASMNLKENSQVGVFPISTAGNGPLFDGYTISEQNLSKILFTSSDVRHKSFVIDCTSEQVDSGDSTVTMYTVTFVSLGHYFECKIPEDSIKDWEFVFANIKIGTGGALSPSVAVADGSKTVVDTRYTVVLSDTFDPSFSASLRILIKEGSSYVVPTPSYERIDFICIDTDETFLVCGDSKIFLKNSPQNPDKV